MGFQGFTERDKKGRRQIPSKDSPFHVCIPILSLTLWLNAINQSFRHSRQCFLGFYVNMKQSACLTDLPKNCHIPLKKKKKNLMHHFHFPIWNSGSDYLIQIVHLYLQIKSMWKRRKLPKIDDYIWIMSQLVNDLWQQEKKKLHCSNSAS